ncbi:hypothetical protein BTM29_12100 [Companilactobacillus allii]|uniref:Cobalt ABC transporter permease n=3 Tax=Companilactobacillus allii TaxID=1847728 RepID=A0A1P8Q5X3_9LACO|nr:energy-coupling factor transporter transmembrane component T [Companilactobacillus allii]APX73242.1 hypothetical protein BTM29_12100 [Companilactobacillus allii]
MKKIYSGFKQSTNSFSILMYLVSVIVSSLIFNNPIIILAIFISLLIVIIFTTINKLKSYMKFTSIIFVTTLLFNLIINQRGTNIIFQMPFIKITNESLLNAGILAFSFVNLLLAFYIYDALTNVKIIFDLMSRSLQSIAIVFILTIKFIPRIIEIFESTNYLYKFRNTNNIGKNKIKKQMNIVEIVLNKAIANFMNVSDVLITKGYNNRDKVKQRINSSKSDYVLFIVSLLTVVFNIIMAFLNLGKVSFGSATVNILMDKKIIIISLINFIMIIMPILIGGSQYLWWKWYVSKITASNIPTAKNFR